MGSYIQDAFDAVTATMVDTVIPALLSLAVLVTIFTVAWLWIDKAKHTSS